MECPLGQLGSAVLTVSPQLLEHPQPPLWWNGVRSRKGLGWVRVLPINNESIPGHCLKHKLKTQLNTLLLLWNKISSTPIRTSIEMHKLCCLSPAKFSRDLFNVVQDTCTESWLNKFLVEVLGSNLFFEGLKPQVFPCYNFLSQRKGQKHLFKASNSFCYFS